MLPIIISIFISCQPQKEVANNNTDQLDDADFVIAFGSCNRADLPQVMWPEIIKTEPDLWIWLGDNMYGDSESMDTLRKKYDQVANTPGYQQLKAKAEITGTWDDHDYGKNDGGKEFKFKEGSLQAFLDFFEVPKDHPRRSRRGAYSSTEHQIGDVTIKVILLDSRYHRDSVARVDGVYQTNDTGTILGQEQWDWLKNELTNSNADIHIVGNGIQYLAQDHRFEKWANFPKERERLIRLIAESKAKGVILLSGDRHIAEVSEIEQEGLLYPLRDITSSGLTHSYEEAGDEPNRYRVSPLIGQKNFGLLKVSDLKGQVRVNVSLKGLSDTTFYQAQWTY